MARNAESTACTPGGSPGGACGVQPGGASGEEDPRTRHGQHAKGGSSGRRSCWWGEAGRVRATPDSGRAAQPSRCLPSRVLPSAGPTSSCLSHLLLCLLHLHALQSARGSSLGSGALVWLRFGALSCPCHCLAPGAPVCRNPLPLPLAQPAGKQRSVLPGSACTTQPLAPRNAHSPLGVFYPLPPGTALWLHCAGGPGAPASRLPGEPFPAHPSSHVAITEGLAADGPIPGHRALPERTGAHSSCSGECAAVKMLLSPSVLACFAYPWVGCKAYRLMHMSGPWPRWPCRTMPRCWHQPRTRGPSSASTPWPQGHRYALGPAPRAQPVPIQAILGALGAPAGTDGQRVSGSPQSRA